MTVTSSNETRARAQLGTDATDAVRSTAVLLEQISALGQLTGCSPVSWSWSSSPCPNHNQLVLVGTIGSRHPAAIHRSVQQWATVLGLTATTQPIRGTVEYQGDIAGLPVRVWAVLDRSEFYRETGERSFAQHFAGQLTLTGLLGLGLTGAIAYSIRSGALAKAASMLRRS
jgi:hypothetical protein